MRFSVLDRAAMAVGEEEGHTLRAVAQHAAHVEDLGFARFLVAEHHAVPGIPGSQPAILASYVASQTARIQVGTAGIMVPNHPPLIIAEQAAMLESLYPGRIIIGLGSSVGFTKPVREALRQTVEAKQRFDSDLAQVCNFLLGDAPITLRPHAQPPLFVLAGFRSALSAAKLGLGVILGGPVETQIEAARVYRENFQGTSPVVISSLNIAVAEDETSARRLLLPEAYAQALSRSAGVFGALDPDPDLSGLTGQQRERLEQMLANTVYGTPAAVEAKLADIAEKLGVEEFLVTGDMPDREGRAHSEELLAGLDLFTR